MPEQPRDEPASARSATELAARLVRVFHPATVLEVGCGDGALVAALRALGVDATGVEPDEASLRHADDDVRPHLRHLTMDESLDAKVDLIVSLDTLSHLSADRLDAAITRMCDATERIVVSVHPDAGSATSAESAVAPEDLSALLATHGFLRSASSGVGLLADHLAVYEQHRSPTLVEVVQTSERRAFRQQAELTSLRARVDELEADLVAAASRAPARPVELRAMSDQLDAAIAERDHARAEAEAIRAEHAEVSARFEDQLARVDADAGASRAELHERRLEVLRLRDLVIGREEQLGTALGRLAEAESELTSYTGLPAKYHEVVNSTTWKLMWRVMTPYRKVRERLGARV